MMEAIKAADVLKFHVESRIKHRYARTVITSIVANNADKAQEVYFRITLPESAFISAFQMEIDGKVYKANVKEKEEAKKDYTDAVAMGLSAGHVEQSVRDSSKFTVSVNVEKTKTVTFKLTYEELLKRELSAYKHLINIDPGQVVPELLVEVFIEESSNISVLEVPPVQEKCELHVESGTSTEVNTLVKIERPQPNEAVIRWSPNIEDQKKLGNIGVRGQLLVRYDVDRQSNPEEILINNGYFVHFFAPTDLPVLRKHVVFVLDVSGSMQGRKIEQMKDAMKTILTDVGSNDYFSLIIFSTDVRVWDPDEIEPLLRAEREGFSPHNFNDLPETVVVPATVSNIEKAKLFVACLHDDCATNIHGALLRAVEVAHLGKKLHKSEKILGPRPEPIIIFLTDGQPNVGQSDPEKITTHTTMANKDAGAALFSLAFGDDADMEFLKKLSLRNSGFARKIYEAADAALQLNQFYRLVASPLLANVQFKYEDKEIVPGSVTNTNFRTLFGGSELVVAGRLSSDAISGEMVSDSCGVQKCTCICKPTVIPKKEHEFMERLWAFLTIKQLLDNITAETDVAENKKRALELALKYSFVTPLTSLVVVKPDESTQATDTERADAEKRDGGRFRGAKLRSRMMKYSPARSFEPAESAIPHFSGFGSSSTQSTASFGSPAVLSTAHFGSGIPQSTASFGSPAMLSTAHFGSGIPQSTASFGSPGMLSTAHFGSGIPQSAASFSMPPSSQCFGSSSPNTFGAHGGSSFFGLKNNSSMFGMQNSPAMFGSQTSRAFPASFPTPSPMRVNCDETVTACDVPEIEKCKVSSLHVKSSIWCRYASTVMEQVFVNSGSTTEEINFNMYLTVSAVISQCSFSLDGKVKTLRLLANKDGEQNFRDSKNTNKAAVLVRPSTSDGQRGTTVCVVLPPQTTLTFKFQYEEFLEDFGDGYLYTVTLSPGQIVPDIQITVNVEGFYKISNARALHVIPFSPKEEGNFSFLDQVEVKFSPDADHKKAVLSWSPSIEEQTKLFGPDHTIQLGFEYKTQQPSFGSDGPAGEVVLDKSGQTIHMHLPSPAALEAEAGAIKRHLILLLHVGSKATAEMREQITAAACNLLLKLHDKDLFSIIVCSSDIQVWKDSGSVVSGVTSLATDRFPASHENITKAKDFVTQALSMVSPKVSSIEAALTNALEMSSPTEQSRPKIFVLSAGGISTAEADTRAIATQLKKANMHKTTIFALACDCAPLLELFRDISTDSSGFACELHKQTVERLLDLFFRISEFNRINCKIVRQLPVFEGFMEKFWLKEAIEQTTGDSKIKMSLTHNIATSETSFFAANE